jgi:hypothetical protein
LQHYIGAGDGMTRFVAGLQLGFDLAFVTVGKAGSLSFCLLFKTAGDAFYNCWMFVVARTCLC